MIVEYIRYAVTGDQAAALEAAYGRARGALESSPNCLGYELARGHEEPDNYILRIVWDSLDGHLEGFRKGPQFPDFLAEVRPFISQILEMKHYVVTDIRSESR